MTTSQFDESQHPRDPKGQFATKGPAPEDKMVVLESPSYQESRDAVRADPVFKQMTDEMVAGYGGNHDAALEQIGRDRFNFMLGANKEYARRGGTAGGHIGAVTEALEAELAERRDSAHQAAQALGSGGTAEEDAGGLEDMLETGRRRRRPAAATPPPPPPTEPEYEDEPELPAPPQEDDLEPEQELPAPPQEDDPVPQPQPAGDGFRPSEFELSPRETPRLHQGRRGQWVVESSHVESQPSADPNFNRMLIHMAGKSDIRVRNNAAAAIIREEDGETIDNKVSTLCRSESQMTVLAVTPTGSVVAMEGRGFTDPDGREAIISKGARSRGHYLRDLNVVGVERGYGRQEALASEWTGKVSSRMPRLAPVTDCSEVPVADTSNGWAEARDEVAAVYMVNHRFPGQSSAIPGTMFLATDRQPGAGGDKGDIVNGYFWTPEGRGPLTSESSSFYSADLRQNAARVVDYQPNSMSMDDCYESMPPSATEAYRRVLGQSYHDE